MSSTVYETESCIADVIVLGIDRRLACEIRDLKHHDGSHDDGIPEAHFLFRSCAETE